MTKETYILIEVSDRNFMIASRQIGRKDAFTFVATCRNRGQADRMVNLLNGGKQ